MKMTLICMKMGVKVEHIFIWFPDVDLAPVVQRVDNAIHRINHYQADKCWKNKLDYPLDSDLSGG